MTTKILKYGRVKERVDGTKFGEIEYAVYLPDFAPTTFTDPAGYNTNHNNVLLQPGIPQRFIDVHPHDGGMICQHREVEFHQDSRHTHIVTAYFDSRITLDARDDDPKKWPVRGGIRTYTEEVPVFVDSVGRPLINAAGDYYEGQTRRRRMVEYNCTAYFAVPPSELFQLVGTVNNSSIEIHGRTYGPYMASVTNMSMPDTPERYKLEIDPFYALYWPVSYSIVINPDQWITVLPNRGYNELSYEWRLINDEFVPQTDWIRTTYQEYLARQNVDLNQTRVRKIRITEDNDAETSNQLWLTEQGESIGPGAIALNGTLRATTTAGNTSITLTQGSVSAADIGTLLNIPGVGTEGRNLQCRITAVASPTQLTVYPPPQTARTGTQVWTYGLSANTFELDEIANWSNLPLPNNHV